MKLYIRTIADIPARLAYAATVIGQMLAGGVVVVSIAMQSRNEEQSRKFHAMCGDISRQCEWEESGGRRSSGNCCLSPAMPLRPISQRSACQDWKASS